jgi:hypothetical protein
MKLSTQISSGSLRGFSNKLKTLWYRAIGVVIIIISDFLQDKDGEVEYLVEERIYQISKSLSGSLSPPEGKHSHGENGKGQVLTSNNANNSTAQVSGKIELSRFALIGISIEKPKKPVKKKPARSVKEPAEPEFRDRPEARPVDLLPLLKFRFPNAWQEFPLKDILGKYSPHDRIQLTGATSAEIRIDVDDTLYLKYEPNPRHKPILTEVRAALSADEVHSGRAHRLALQLRTRPDPGSASPTLQIRYRLDDGLETPLTSTIDHQGSWNSEIVQAGNIGKFEFWLASQLDVSRSLKLELLLAVPERMIIYAIPVVILPTPGEGAIQVFQLIVGFFAACVVALCVPMLRSWWEELRPWEWAFVKYIGQVSRNGISLVAWVPARIIEILKEPE